MQQRTCPGQRTGCNVFVMSPGTYRCDVVGAITAQLAFATTDKQRLVSPGDA